MLDIHTAKGFIFDCDGTLLDTLGAWEEAERDLFAQAGDLTQEQEDEIHSAPIERAAEIFCMSGMEWGRVAKLCSSTSMGISCRSMPRKHRRSTG